MNITEVRAELEGYAAELAALAHDDEGARAGRARCCRRSTSSTRPRRPGLADALRRAHPPLHLGGGRATRYLVETLERYFTHSLRIWYLVLDRVPSARPRRARPGPPPGGAARPRRRPRARTSCASTCSPSSARSSRRSAAADPAALGCQSRRAALHQALRAGERAHAAAPERLEVGREGEERLRGRERVALRDVRTMSGQPRPRAIGASAHASPGRRSPRWTQSSRQSSAVSTMRLGMRATPERSRGRRARPTRACDHRDAPLERGARAGAAPRALPAPRRGRPSAGRGSRPTPAAGGLPGRTRPLTAAAGGNATLLDGQRGERDDLVARRVEPGRLDVHHDEAAPLATRTTPSPRARPSSTPMPRWTFATGRKASLSAVRVSGARLFGVDQVVGRAARPQLLDLVLHAQRRTSARRRRAG